MDHLDHLDHDAEIREAAPLVQHPTKSTLSQIRNDERSDPVPVCSHPLHHSYVSLSLSLIEVSAYLAGLIDSRNFWRD